MFKLTIIACGNKMPSWVEEAAKDYSKRLKEYVLLNVIEVPLIKRTKSSDLNRILEKESALVIAAIPHNARAIALELTGESFSSEGFAKKFETLQLKHSHICILNGGPEGHSKQTLNRCDEYWSLSQLTLPHPMVRIVLLEAIYRAWAIINHHPYHK
jgi:23S rRNA (pseudouridine1915-N3)-methyltransferase